MQPDRDRYERASSGIGTASFWPTFFARIVGRLQWDPAAIDFSADARAWPQLPAERRDRLMTLLAGFCVAEEAVSEHLQPFGPVAEITAMASDETLVSWADGILPGVREGVERIELDERWHIGFGLRCLVETKPSADLIEELLARAEVAAEAWGDAVPAGTRDEVARSCARRLSVAGLMETRAAA